VEGAGRHQHRAERKHVERRLFVAADPVRARLREDLLGRDDLGDIGRGDGVCPPARGDRAADQLADPPGYAGGGDEDEEGGLLAHNSFADDQVTWMELLYNTISIPPRITGMHQFYS